jgi:diguanylate cyclase (GGDEF)-like protein
MHLARLEAHAALGRLLERLPGLGLDPGRERPRVGGLVFRKPAAVHAVWPPRELKRGARRSTDDLMTVASAADEIPMPRFFDHPRARRVGPFAAAAAVAFAVAPVGGPVVWSSYAAAVGLAALVVVAVPVAPWQRLTPWMKLVPAVAFLAAAALLRDAVGGAGGGVGLLPLLPLTWLALHGSRAQLLVLLGITTAFFVAPVLLVGGPLYPAAAGLRSALLFAAIGGVVGLTVQALVQAGRRREEELAALAAEHEALAGHLRGIATRDPLTRLGNRGAWEGWLTEEFARAARARTPLCVAMLDLDHFKAFNDAHGHQAGDVLLEGVARAWRDQLRPGDRLARYGGEEFALLLPATGLTEALAVVDRLRAGVPGAQTCSAGVAEWDGLEVPAAVVRRADEALYAAKDAGRDRALAGPARAMEAAPAP